MLSTTERIKDAFLRLVGADAAYEVEFFKGFNVGKSWEFDKNSKVNVDTKVPTGFITVSFSPARATMAFPTDWDREKMYIMTIDNARLFWQYLKANFHAQYWYALNIASSLSKDDHQYDNVIASSIANKRAN